MASDLLTLPEARRLIETGTPNDILERFIDAADAAIRRVYGPHSGDRTETLRPVENVVWLATPALTTASVSEYGSHEPAADAQPVLADRFELRHGGRAIEGVGHQFKANVVVIYTPSATTAERASMLIDLVRLADQYEGVSESTVGPVTTKHLDYDKERRAILNRMKSLRPGSAFA